MMSEPTAHSEAVSGDSSARKSTPNSVTPEQPAAPPPEPEPTDNAPTVISKVPRSPVPIDRINLAERVRNRRLAHFELEETLGIGGMAAVIRARDTLLDRSVALKILPPEMAADAENVRRFENEAKAAAKLDHENIARVFYCGEDQGLHFIAFEYVRGVNLRVMVDKRGPLPAAEAVHYTLQIATGLVHAAERGVIHRDIKPSNIIVTEDGRAKLVDMGLARHQAKLTGEGLTHSGVTLGTFDYISPEQAIEPRCADVRSDIYSLGCTLYHLLTGQPPVPEGTAARKLQFHQNESPIDPRQIVPEIPDEVAAIVARMIAKDPKDRYQRPEYLVQHLLAVAQKLSGQAPSPSGNGVYLVEAILPSPPKTRPLTVLVTAALAVAVLIGVLALLGDMQLGGANRGPEAAANSPASTLRSVPPIAMLPAQGGSPPLDAPQVDVLSARELRENVARGQSAVLRLDTLFYDLVDDDASTDRPAGLSWSNNELRIEAKPGASPTLRLTSRLSEGLAKERPALLVNGGKLTIRGVRFLLDPNTGSAPLTALAVQAGELRLINCEFVQKENSGPASLSLLKVLRSATTAPPLISFQNCVLAGGQNGILVEDAANITLTNCRFGPYLLPIQLRDRTPDATPAEITLRGCTGLFWPRPVVDISSPNPCVLKIEHSLLSVTDNPLHASVATLLMLSHDQEKDKIRFQGNGNYYHRFANLVVQGTEDDGWEEVVRDVPEFGRFGFWRDQSSRKTAENPWQDADPWRALKEGKTLAELRLKPDWDKGSVLAADSSANSPMTELPTKKTPGNNGTAGTTPTAAADTSFKEVVVDGKGQAGGAYRNLATALTDTQGDVQITVKLNGKLETPSLEILGTRRVHIRAAAGFHPELMLHPDAVPGADGETALLRLHDGELTLEGLAFRLQPGLKEIPKVESVLSITGVGHAKLKDCVATLAGDGAPRMAVAAVADPTGSMMGAAGKPPRSGSPAIELEDCFVRGNGDMVTVRVSRPYRLDVRNGLVVLGGSLLSEEGNKSEAAAGSEGASISLDRVTAYMTQNLIVLRTTMANPVHVPLRIAPATTCIFAAAEGGPLVSIDGPQSESELKRWLTWSGKRNVYSTSGSILVWQPLERADMPHKYDGDRWNDLWGREDDEPRFARDIRFAGFPTAIKTRVDVAPEDFRIIAPEGQEKELAGRGADLEKLPKPPAPEKTGE